MIFISGSLKELQETFKNTKEKDEAGGGGGKKGVRKLHLL